MQQINTTTKGAVYAGGLGVGAARTQGIAQSASSLNATPPRRRGEGGLPWGVIAVVLGMMAFAGGATGMGIILLLGAVGAGWSYAEASKWNKNVYPQMYRRWENTFRCNRCEHWFNLRVA